MKPFSSGAKILARIGRCGDRQVKGAKRALGHTLGGMAVGQVERGEVSALHHRLRDTPSLANTAVGVLSKIFSVAEAWELTPPGRNSCRAVRHYGTRPRERFLTDEVFRRLGWGGSSPPAAGSGDDRHAKPAASLPALGSNFQCASIRTRFSRRGPVKEARGIVGGVGDGDSNDDDGSVVSPACLLGTNMAGTNWE